MKQPIEIKVVGSRRHPGHQVFILEVGEPTHLRTDPVDEAPDLDIIITLLPPLTE